MRNNDAPKPQNTTSEWPNNEYVQTIRLNSFEFILQSFTIGRECRDNQIKSWSRSFGQSRFGQRIQSSKFVARSTGAVEHQRLGKYEQNIGFIKCPEIFRGNAGRHINSNIFILILLLVHIQIHRIRSHHLFGAHCIKIHFLDFHVEKLLQPRNGEFVHRITFLSNKSKILNFKTSRATYDSMFLRRLANSFGESALHLRLFHFLLMLLLLAVLPQFSSFFANQSFRSLVTQLVPAGLSIFIVGPIFQFGRLHNGNVGRTSCLQPRKILLWIFGRSCWNQYFRLFDNVWSHILFNEREKNQFEEINHVNADKNYVLGKNRQQALVMVLAVELISADIVRCVRQLFAVNRPMNSNHVLAIDRKEQKEMSLSLSTTTIGWNVVLTSLRCFDAVELWLPSFCTTLMLFRISHSEFERFRRREKQHNARRMRAKMPRRNDFRRPKRWTTSILLQMKKFVLMCWRKLSNHKLADDIDTATTFWRSAFCSPFAPLCLLSYEFCERSDLKWNW